MTAVAVTIRVGLSVVYGIDMTIRTVLAHHRAAVPRNTM